MSREKPVSRCLSSINKIFTSGWAQACILDHFGLFFARSAHHKRPARNMILPEGITSKSQRVQLEGLVVEIRQAQTEARGSGS